MSGSQNGIENSSNMYKDQSTEPMQVCEVESTKNKCSAETSTDELLNYASTEVQTFDLPNLESDSNNKSNPVENLSVRSKI